MSRRGKSAFALGRLVPRYVGATDVLRRRAFVVHIGNALAAAAADLEGDVAEPVIRGFPGVRPELIHDHGERGESALAAAGVLGVLVGMGVVSGMMAYTGLLGGPIRHGETRPGATRADAMVVEPRPSGR